MSKMRIVMFALAAGSAVVAGILAKGVISKGPEMQAEVVAKIKTVPVLVAAKDIEVGERLASGTIIWKDWPADNLLDAMITKEEKPDADVAFAETRARIPMYEGEVINEKKIVDPKTGGFMSAILPKGMRAISVAISSRSSAGGFILPNDRVDIILTRKASGSGGSNTSKSETAIGNVRVLAINQVFRQAKDGEEVTIKEGQTATVELTAPQAEIITRLESEGELSLALRSIAESDGKAMEEGPQLAEKYVSNGKKPRSTDTLFIRYGRETYATNN